MILELQEKLGNLVREHEPLSRHTNFRIGGPARYFFEAPSSDGLVAAVQTAVAVGVPYFILGGGSNVLVSDAGFDGLVIKAANRNWEITDQTVYAEAGVLSAFLARKTAEAGLTGFEWAISLPGTIGGGVRGNAGCFGGEMKDVVKRVDVFDPSQTKLGTLDARRCEFRYRDSIFKHLDPPPIILGAELELRTDDPTACLARLEEKLRSRKEKQPLDASSAGCLFKNVEFSDRGEIATLESRVAVPEDFITARRIPAGWIIDQLGLKGTQIGGVQISEKHGNFMINRGKATADEVVQLAALVKTRARNEFGIQLHEEVQFVGF